MKRCSFGGVFVFCLVMLLTMGFVALPATAAVNTLPAPQISEATVVVQENGNLQVQLMWDVADDNAVDGFEVFADGKFLKKVEKKYLAYGGRFVWTKDYLKGSKGSVSFQVRSYVEGVAYSPLSKPVTVDLVQGGDTTPPSVPTWIRATRVDKNELVIDWESSLDKKVATDKPLVHEWSPKNVYYRVNINGFEQEKILLQNTTTIKNIPANSLLNIKITPYDFSHNPTNKSISLQVTTPPHNSFSYLAANELRKLIPGGKKGNGDSSEIFITNSLTQKVKNDLWNERDRLKNVFNMKLNKLITGNNLLINAFAKVGEGHLDLSKSTRNLFSVETIKGVLGSIFK
jgi:hypothetical protein